MSTRLTDTIAPLTGGFVGAGAGVAVAGAAEAVGMGMFIGMGVGVADGASDEAPPPVLVADGAALAAAIGVSANEADGPGATTLVATALGAEAAARAAGGLVGAAAVACVHAVNARIAIERVRIKFHMRGP